MIAYLAVGLGGALGSMLRYFISQHSDILPIHSTLLINIVGSAALAILTAVSFSSGESNRIFILFLGVGLCGGFTTFSAFGVQTMQLYQNGQFVLAVAHTVFHAILCILASAFGFGLVKWFSTH